MDLYKLTPSPRLTPREIIGNRKDPHPSFGFQYLHHRMITVGIEVPRHSLIDSPHTYFTGHSPAIKRRPLRIVQYLGRKHEPTVDWEAVGSKESGLAVPASRAA